MGREIRRVPLGWQHPKDAQGRHIPLRDKTYLEAFAEWQGFRTYPQAIFDVIHLRDTDLPTRSHYRPSWQPGTATCYQVYENVSMGTPISPVLESKLGIVRWALMHGYSSDAAWAFVERGFSYRPDHLQGRFGQPFNKFGEK